LVQARLSLRAAGAEALPVECSYLVLGFPSVPTVSIASSNPIQSRVNFPVYDSISQGKTFLFLSNLGAGGTDSKPASIHGIGGRQFGPRHSLCIFLFYRWTILPNSDHNLARFYQ
jgi:hypothetical protein